VPIDQRGGDGSDRRGGGHGDGGVGVPASLHGHPAELGDREPAEELGTNGWSPSAEAGQCRFEPPAPDGVVVEHGHVAAPSPRPPVELGVVETGREGGRPLERVRRAGPVDGRHAGVPQLDERLGPQPQLLRRVLLEHVDGVGQQSQRRRRIGPALVVRRSEGGGGGDHGVDVRDGQQPVGGSTGAGTDGAVVPPRRRQIGVEGPTVRWWSRWPPSRPAGRRNWTVASVVATSTPWSMAAS
jgi:hypothetical protein